MVAIDTGWSMVAIVTEDTEDPHIVNEEIKSMFYVAMASKRKEKQRSDFFNSTFLV